MNPNLTVIIIMNYIHNRVEGSVLVNLLTDSRNIKLLIDNHNGFEALRVNASKEE